MTEMTKKILKITSMKWMRKIKKKIRKERGRNPRKRKERLMPDQKQEM